MSPNLFPLRAPPELCEGSELSVESVECDARQGGALGHIRLGHIPNSRQWRRVVALLDGDAAAPDIISASAEAIESALSVAARDPVLAEATRLLAMLPQAARSPNFGAALRRLGVDVPSDPTLLQLTTAIGRALDQRRDLSKPSTDFTEIARSALVETVSALVGPRLPGLFGATPEDVRLAVEQLGRGRRFSDTAHEFFSRVTRDALGYYLSRVLSAHIGNDRAIASIQDRRAFDAALDRHCREASRIIQEFAAGWYGKTLFERGEIDRLRARDFAHVALKKIRTELERSREDAI